MNWQWAVLGHPISHSLSPQIHQAFAQQLGMKVRYDAIDVAPDGFAEHLERLIAQGYNGFNVTVPHKEHASQWATHLSGRASRATSVNVLFQDSERNNAWSGDTTDGSGLLYDLTQLQEIPLQGRRILLLGAGGAARGVMESLLHSYPATLAVWNRTPARAEALCEQFTMMAQQCSVSLLALPAEQLAQPWDLVINATAASLADSLPNIPEAALLNSTACYDMVYGAKPTAFLDWAQSLGVSQRCDGLGMLVGQAAESFYLWTGQRPHCEPVLTQLRETLAQRHRAQ